MFFLSRNSCKKLYFIVVLLLVTATGAVMTRVRLESRFLKTRLKSLGSNDSSQKFQKVQQTRLELESVCGSDSTQCWITLLDLCLFTQRLESNYWQTCPEVIVLIICLIFLNRWRLSEILWYLKGLTISHMWHLDCYVKFCRSDMIDHLPTSKSHLWYF